MILWMEGVHAQNRYVRFSPSHRFIVQIVLIIPSWFGWRKLGDIRKRRGRGRGIEMMWDKERAKEKNVWYLQCQKLKGELYIEVVVSSFGSLSLSLFLTAKFPSYHHHHHHHPNATSRHSRSVASLRVSFINLCSGIAAKDSFSFFLSFFHNISLPSLAGS